MLKSNYYYSYVSGVIHVPMVNSIGVPYLVDHNKVVSCLMAGFSFEFLVCDDSLFSICGGETYERVQ